MTNYPPALTFMVFDHAVNAGVGASVRLLQAAVEVTVDGAMGPRTLLAACQADPNGLVLRLRQAQTEFYDADTEPLFRQGLVRRVALRTNAALAMLSQTRVHGP